jgi:hypothetical protein
MKRHFLSTGCTNSIQKPSLFVHGQMDRNLLCQLDFLTVLKHEGQKLPCSLLYVVHRVTRTITPLFPIYSLYDVHHGVNSSFCPLPLCKTQREIAQSRRQAVQSLHTHVYLAPSIWTKAPPSKLWHIHSPINRTQTMTKSPVYQGRSQQQIDEDIILSVLELPDYNCTREQANCRGEHRRRINESVKVLAFSLMDEEYNTPKWQSAIKTLRWY